jgi:hypothetical protein
VSGVRTVPDLPVLAELTVAGRAVAVLVDGAALPGELSPRPFLHPVRTAGGVVVSDACPADHAWHLGVGVAVQDVAGSNLWGGRTYVRDQGYTWRGDHGTMRVVGVHRAGPGADTATLEWCDAAGRPVLAETRTASAHAVGGAGVPAVWRLDLGTVLANPGPVAVPLGSPATNGRTAAGYGGFFWRLPTLDHGWVRTEDAAGEDAVHGSTSAWLAVGGRRAGADVTLVAAQVGTDPPDPWFVRMAGYPGWGTSFAATEPLPVPAGGRIVRRLRVVVADGSPDPRALAALLPGGGARP